MIPEPTPAAVAAGVREALELGPEAGLAARERIRTEFPYEKRRDGLLARWSERSPASAPSSEAQPHRVTMPLPSCILGPEWSTHGPTLVRL